jgi:hypothetical protein
MGLDPGPEGEARELISRLFRQGIYLRVSADGQRVEANESLDPASAEELARLEPIVGELIKGDDSP